MNAQKEQRDAEILPSAITTTDSEKWITGSTNKI
jgi:hypothetical protein